MPKAIKVDKDGIVLLSQFLDWIDISNIQFYSLKAKKDKIVIKFYDENKKLVKPYEKR